MNDAVDIIVCGHLCIDLIPDLGHITPEALIAPGRLNESGAMVVSTGGAVSNTGLTLHRLGVNVGLMSAVGDGFMGQLTLAYLNQRDPLLTRFITTRPGEGGSYTIALSPQGADRTFLSHPATNDAYGADDVDYAVVERATVFHLGYPSLMARMREDDGAQLRLIFQRAKAAGVVTSMDMARPDPETPSGRLDWRALLRNVLPYVDIFVPSIEEALFMLRREEFDAWHGDVLSHISRDYLRGLSGDLLDMGAAVAGFKLGEMGLYLRAGSAETLQRLARLPIDRAAWSNAEVWQPAFQVEVVGTTGAGDSAYAGLLAAMLRGMTPEAAVRWACAVGACNVEAADSNSGIRSWEETRARVEHGWETRGEVLR